MNVSELKVLHTPAGWYVGRTCYDEECQVNFPYDRTSDYFDCKEAAEHLLTEIHCIIVGEM